LRVLDLGAQADARGTAQVLGHGGQTVARDAATLPQQEKNNLGNFTAEPSKFYRLYLSSGKVTRAVIYLRRVLGAAAQNFGVGRCREQA
jgi:hypothetical protein